MMFSKILRKNKGSEKRLTTFLSCLIVLLLSNITIASPGDIYVQGTVYRAGTYVGHPSYLGHNDRFNVVDLNVGGGNADCNLPLYAPESGGTVTRIHTNHSGWGNSITWSKGSESIFMAHLSSFGNDGSVDGGDIIGYVGTTGNSSTCHVHTERNLGRLILSGDQITPEDFTPTYNGPAYTSSGPLTYDLRLYSSIIKTPSIFVQNEPAIVDFQLANFGSGDFTGSIAAALHDTNGNFVEDIQRFDNVLINSLTYDDVFFESESISVNPGNYQIQMKYRASPSDGAGWHIINQGSYTNPINVLVNASSSPSVPSTPSASDGIYSDKVRMTWNAVSGATTYKMYRCTSTSTSSCNYLGSDSSSPYDDTGGTAGTTYYYRIKASNSYGDSGYSNYNTGYKAAPGPTVPNTPGNPAASDGTFTDKVLIAWVNVSGATSYKLFRCISASNSSCTQLSTVVDSGNHSTIYSDYSVNAGTVYYYRVKATNSAGSSEYSAYDTGYRSESNQDVNLSNSVPQNHSMTNDTPGAGWRYYYFDVSSGASTLFADLTNLSADLDLYLSFNTKPTSSDYDCRSSSGGTVNDHCTVQNPSSGRWWIGINNYDTGAINFTIKATWNYSEGPDIHIYPPVNLNPNPLVSQVYTVETVVQNYGDINTGVTTLRYYSSPDATINQSDFEFHDVSFASLTPGEYITNSINVTTSASGYYYFGVCIDSVAGETNITNNCSGGLLVNVYDSDVIFKAGFESEPLRKLSINNQNSYLGDYWNHSVINNEYLTESMIFK